MFLNSRDKSLTIKGIEKAITKNGSVLVAETADISQKAQFGLVMQIFNYKTVEKLSHDYVLMSDLQVKFICEYFHFNG